MGLKIVADIETDGLLDTLSVIHSLVLRERGGDILLSCTDNPAGLALGYRPISDGLAMLSDAEAVYFHNGIKFDIPALQKVYPTWTYRGRILDTMVIAQMRFAHIRERDFANARRGTFRGFAGGHRLEDWGYRLGEWKGDYTDWCKEQGIEDPWAEWRPEMQTYCEQDTKVTDALADYLGKSGVSAESVEIEHELAWYLAAQERNGWPFDMEAAIALNARLAARREALGEVLREYFGWWFAPNGVTNPKRGMNRKDGLVTAGAPYTKLKQVEFNPKSPDHLARCLTQHFGWKPETFTPTGKPQVDEKALKGIEGVPIVDTLREFLLVKKRLEQISEGKEAWLNHATDKSPFGGKLTGLVHIHGRVKQNHAITHRASHTNPNTAQVPKVGSPFGEECRALYHVPGGNLLPAHLEWDDPDRPGTKLKESDTAWLARVTVERGSPPEWVQIGADASGLELRCLAHYMAKYDDGAYGRVILEGDIHTENRLVLGLPEVMPEGALFSKGRDVMKTWIYAYLYGAGDEKLGSILEPGAPPERKKALGKDSRQKFQTGLAAMGLLVDSVKRSAKTKGYLKMPDGRRTYVRHEHAALNSLLQSAGAIICKKWIVVFNRKLVDRFGPQGWNGKWAALGWIHDEVQLAVRPEIAEEVKSILVESIREVGVLFNWRCPLDGEAKVGGNWAQTH